MADVSVTVVGAGVVGLAVAARLAEDHPDLILLDRNPRHGMECSSRNSQVIHAGIYYPPGSLKARLCREGNERLYALCAAHDIPHRRLGKIITAASLSGFYDPIGIESPGLTAAPAVAEHVSKLFSGSVTS